MKLIGVISTAVLCLTLGAAALVYAQEQHEQQEEQKAKPAQDEKKAQPAKPAQQEEKNTKPEEKSAQQEKNSKPEEKTAQQAKPAAPAKTAAGRIPDDRYKANFGREHTFHVTQGDYGNRRFQYGGYWFGFAGAWPSNWLYTQNVYVLEINGVYYLCNPMYPGVNVELSVTL
ncbi:MAG: hypothetical protein WA188_02450 [Terriglobales bacterium]